MYLYMLNSIDFNSDSIHMRPAKRENIPKR